MGSHIHAKLECVMYTPAHKELVVFLQDTHGPPDNIKHIFRDSGGTHTSALRLAKCLGTI